MENVATEKQIALIKKLQEEKQTVLIEDFENLTKSAASAIIGKLIYKIKIVKEESATPKIAKPQEEKQELKSIQLITDDLEKAKIISLAYDDNAFLNWYTDKKNKMNDYITKKLKEYKVFKTFDNLNLCIDFDKKEFILIFGMMTKPKDQITPLKISKIIT